MTGLFVAYVIAISMPSSACEQCVQHNMHQRLAQAMMGFTCTTQFGNCPIPPQPIGSACYCGETAGFVTQ